MRKPSHAAFIFLFIFVKTSFCAGKNMSSNNHVLLCPEIEKQSLLRFKQSLKDPASILSSWDGEVDCCRWKGVVCSNFTGHIHVSQLHLHGEEYEQGLSGKINPSLLNLKYLTHLDLSQNSFGETIPSFMGSFTNLEFLNLTEARFHGRIPHTIGNLSNLHTLGLGNFEAAVDSLEWLSGLSKLEYLNMNYVNLSQATKWPQQVINTFPSLLELHFHGCSLDFIAPLTDVNSSSLTLLDLSSNHFQSLFVPKWFFQLQNLLFLNLKGGYFRGPLPIFNNATKLRYFDLSANSCNSSIPDWLYLCKDLEFLDLSYNPLSGTISNAIANLTSLKTLNLYLNELSGGIPKEIAHLCKLETLDLSNNNYSGTIPDSFGNVPECLESLEFLSFANNKMSGSIPTSIGKLLALRELYLYDNNFTGNLPESVVRQLVNLQILGIQDNMLRGDVTESHFANLTKLEEFSASANPLTWKISPNWIPPFQLKKLGLGSWKGLMTSHILLWLQKQKNIIQLDLSNTGISGSVPSWFWDMEFLRLSHNHLHGNIPYISYNSTPGQEPYKYIYLNSNQFSGLLPRIGAAVLELDLSDNSFSGGTSHFLCDTKSEQYALRVLHLGGNQLGGELPDCWMQWSSLVYLNLGNNNIFGSIPNSISYLEDFRSFNLYNNRFYGRIPFSMHNCMVLRKIDLSGNDLNGSLPTWMGTSLVNLRILILRSNKLSGNISQEICHLNSLQILDLSNNKFSGVLPGCLSNFTAMATKRSLSKTEIYIEFSYPENVTIATKGRELQYDTILPLVTNIDLSKNNLSGEIPEGLMSLVELGSLNLSGNGFTGLIPDKIGEMKQLESLDLSRNSLAGQIPNSLTQLHYLSYLNLSYNKLMGRIPESTQLQSFDAWSFIGNDLCGPPLTSNCSRAGDDDDDDDDDDDEKGGKREQVEKSKIEWLYVFLSLGYAVGFSAACTALVLKKSWRDAYFGLLQYIWDKIYVYFYVKWGNLTKPTPPS